MKQIINRILVFCCVLIIACQGNAGSQESQQHHNKKTYQHKQNNHRDRDHQANPDDEVSADGAPDKGPGGPEVIDRHPNRLIYTKHARCRMNCRHIDEAEVEEILQEGRINYRKSEPAGRPDPKFALEGTTRDGQDVRIVFAASKRGMVVITVIDLETDWSCNCK
jgi:hypothetical protein